MNHPSFEECYSRSRDSLGQALHEERLTPEKVGHYQTFEHGSIHWHPDTGAFLTRGSIRETWRKLGWENSWIGYPTSEEYPLSELASRELTAVGGKVPEIHPELGRITYSSEPLYAQAQNYQNGLIYWIRAENRCVVLRKLRPVSRDFGMTPRYETTQNQGFLGWVRAHLPSF
jgi:uncharacterized protein with LGFP repeats